MGKRGRPRHPDILTPREWEVLELLRQRLSNEQIAERLGVTHDGAKYHVSQILSKLGVTSREEAAALRLKRQPWLWSLGWIGGAAIAVVEATAGITILVWALAAGDGDEESTQGPVVSDNGFTISGAVSTRITWDESFLPNCYVTTEDDGGQAFFFGATIRGPYQLYASIGSFHGAASYDAAAPPAQIGHFDWRTAAVTVFKLGNDEGERWLATSGDFTVETAAGDDARGSLNADLEPAGPDAKGAIHATGNWVCHHSGN